MSARDAPNEHAQSPTAARRPLWRPKIRQADLIVPRTGERVNRVFTLQSAPLVSDVSDDRTPLLGGPQHKRASPSRLEVLKSGAADLANKSYAFATSKLALGIFKCSLAYLLGSMATFIVPIADFFGRNDSKHMVATVTVYFHPARSAGSMQEATVIALIAFLYAAFISFSSMGVSALFGSLGKVALGHIIVLIVFCGGGLGFVAWTKLRFGSPLVNVACSLASLSIITVLTKEGSVQAAKFSHEKVLQILEMVLMGIASTALVSFIVKPDSARRDLRKDLVKSTDLLAEGLSLITQSFLTGTDNDLKGAKYRAKSKEFSSAFSSLTKNLGESKWEHYVLGTEKEYKTNVKVAKCIETIAQDLRGLRSAAAIQFAVLENFSGPSKPEFFGLHSRSSSALFTPTVSTPASLADERHNILSSIYEEPEEDQDFSFASQAASRRDSIKSIDNVTAPSDIFSMFLANLGPSMKSLAYTLKEVLADLPFDSDGHVNVDSHFRGSLVEASNLFASARKEGLAQLYHHRVLTRSKSTEVAADFEEVAASCGYFSSSLQDLAEHTIDYVDRLEELKGFENIKLLERSWNWLKFWKRFQGPHDEGIMHQHQTEEEGLSKNIPRPRATGTPADPKGPSKNSYRARMWQALFFFRRQDIKFAIKVGVGAMLFAMWSFIPSTQPTYSHWRMEWGLLSYMLVCSMTVGASNTTGFQRSWGTIAGAILAIVVWIVAHGSPYALAFFGWFISLFCFYIIVGLGKGPLGRYILLTYNLSALYSYSLSVKDDDDDDDEGGVDPAIWEIVLHRTCAVLAGCAWGMVITRFIWPLSARKKLKDGLSVLWLRMGLIWKRDPLTILEDGLPGSSYMDIRESIELQRFLTSLQALREAATAEFDLRGAFPGEVFGRLLEATGRILDSFYAMNVVIIKDLKATPGEAEILRYTTKERIQLSSRISHLFSVLASSMKLEYPLNDALPEIEHTRDRLLARIFQFRADADPQHAPADEDYELLYTYTLVTGQLGQDIIAIRRDIEQLYGLLNEDSLSLE